MSKQTQIGPVISYYGAKWRAAKTYPAPKHDIIVEPFAGGAGYSLLHYERDVFLVDKYDRLTAMWRWLIGADPEEIRALPLLSPGDLVSDLDVADPVKTLIGFWVNAGASQPCNTMSSFGRINHEKENACVWGIKCRERLAHASSLIKHWRVVDGSYADIENLTATWFVDPPYQKAGKHYKHSAAAIDFDHLGAWCRERRGQVIVCENEGADWLPFTPHAQIKSTATRGKTHSAEVVWTNEESTEVSK